MRDDDRLIIILSSFRKFVDFLSDLDYTDYSKYLYDIQVLDIRVKMIQRKRRYFVKLNLI